MSEAQNIVVEELFTEDIAKYILSIDESLHEDLRQQSVKYFKTSIPKGLLILPLDSSDSKEFTDSKEFNKEEKCKYFVQIFRKVKPQVRFYKRENSNLSYEVPFSELPKNELRGFYNNAVRNIFKLYELMNLSKPNLQLIENGQQAD